MNGMSTVQPALLRSMPPRGLSKLFPLMRNGTDHPTAPTASPPARCEQRIQGISHHPRDVVTSGPRSNGSGAPSGGSFQQRTPVPVPMKGFLLEKDADNGVRDFASEWSGRRGRTSGSLRARLRPFFASS